MEWRDVTKPNPERTGQNLEYVRKLPLDEALRSGIIDPGAFTPRRYKLDGEFDRTYENLWDWQARACVLIVEDRERT